MSNPDIIRVLNEMQTFTGDDVEKAFEIPHSTANLWLRRMLRDNIVVRVRIGHEYAYALSPRMEKRANALPPVDPEERCLLLEAVVEPVEGLFVPPCPDCGCESSWQQWHGNDGAYGRWKCIGCGEVHRYIDAYDDIPF